MDTKKTSRSDGQIVLEPKLGHSTSERKVSSDSTEMKVDVTASKPIMMRAKRRSKQFKLHEPLASLGYPFSREELSGGPAEARASESSSKHAVDPTFVEAVNNVSFVDEHASSRPHVCFAAVNNFPSVDEHASRAASQEGSTTPTCWEKMQSPTTENWSTPGIPVLRSGVAMVLASFAQYTKAELMSPSRDDTTAPTKSEIHGSRLYITSLL